MKLTKSLALSGLSSLAITQAITYQNLSSSNVRVDTGQTGPAVEEVHYYNDQWPIGLAVSKQGRIFVCYTRGTYVSDAKYSRKPDCSPWANQHELTRIRHSHSEKYRIPQQKSLIRISRLTGLPGACQHRSMASPSLAPPTTRSSAYRPSSLLLMIRSGSWIPDGLAPTRLSMSPCHMLSLEDQNSWQ